MIQIKKRSAVQIMTLYLFFIPIFLNFLQQYLSVPSFIKYTVDAVLVALLFLVIVSKRQYVYKSAAPFYVFTVLFFLYVLICYLFCYQSPFYFLWGLRNNFRYYIAFILFILFLDMSDVRLAMSSLNVIFVIHFCIILIQCFAFGYKGDYLGGIFGTQSGCNSPSLILICIISIKSIIFYLNRHEKLWKCMLRCCECLVIAVLSELKVFVLLLPVILLVSVIITGFSFRKFAMVLGIAAAMVIAVALFNEFWGGNNVLTFEKIKQLITSEHYSSSEDIGRITAIPVITRAFLTDLPKKLFGLGLGNCDTSAFSICNTPFYQSYSHISYSWFSSAFILLETGFTGLAAVLAFFILVGVKSMRLSKRRKELSPYCQVAVVMSIVCIILVFYNSSLRTDIGYLAYFILALPFIADKASNN